MDIHTILLSHFHYMWHAQTEKLTMSLNHHEIWLITSLFPPQRIYMNKWKDATNHLSISLKLESICPMVRASMILILAIMTCSKKVFGCLIFLWITFSLCWKIHEKWKKTMLNGYSHNFVTLFLLYLKSMNKNPYFEWIFTHFITFSLIWNTSAKKENFEWIFTQFYHHIFITFGMPKLKNWHVSESSWNLIHYITSLFPPHGIYMNKWKDATNHLWISLKLESICPMVRASKMLINAIVTCLKKILKYLVYSFMQKCI